MKKRRLGCKAQHSHLNFNAGLYSPAYVRGRAVTKKTCYLGLGSNLQSPERQLRQALGKLRKIPRSAITNRSSLYLSHPCGVRSQPRYVNMVVAITTTLPPHQLLKQCQQIENKHHRIRKKHWGARTLDIDILLYGQRTIHTLDLTIPHPHMLCRDFVLVPLLEICPTECLPSGEPLEFYLKTCPQSFLSRH